MTHFTIDTENNITAHASRTAARKTGDGVFATEEQFADLIGSDAKRLVEIWNSLTGVKPVTKFKDRKTATERIWKAIQSLGNATTPAKEAQEPAEGLPEPEASVPEATAEPELTPEQPNTVAPEAPQTPEAATEEAPAKAARVKKTHVAKDAKAARTGSKTETVLALMKQPGGTTLKAIMEATQWQAHSVRGFISGTLGKKLGLTVVSAKGENGERKYSISA